MSIPPPQSDYAAIPAALASIEKELARAGKVLVTDAYLAGDDFSIADIQLGHCSHRCCDIDLEQANLQHMQAYLRMSLARLGFSQHVMASYAEFWVTKG